MSSRAEVIWAAFGKPCDLYEALGVARDATPKQITTGYRRAALRHHPDKHHGGAKDAATARFQAVSAVHSILSDPEARALYDETGTIAEEDPMATTSDQETPSFEMWLAYFTRLFPTVTVEEIAAFETTYRGSDEEEGDVLAAYHTCEGDMQSILDSVMLSRDEDAERFAAIITKALAEDKTLKTYPKWHEYVKKSKRSSKPSMQDQKAAKREETRRKKEAREAEELMAQIHANQGRRGGRGRGNRNGGIIAQEEGKAALVLPSRERGFSSLIASIEVKYAGDSGSPGSAPASGSRRGRGQAKVKRGKREAAPMDDEPSEEAFQAAQQRLLAGKASNKKSKRQ